MKLILFYLKLSICIKPSAYRTMNIILKKYYKLNIIKVSRTLTYFNSQLQADFRQLANGLKNLN